MENIERLEDADEIRDARQPVGVEHPIGVLFQLVEGAIRHSAEEHARIFVADVPARHDVEERPDRGGAEPLPLALRRKIDQRGWLVARSGKAGSARHRSLLIWSQCTPYEEKIKWPCARQTTKTQCLGAALRGRVTGPFPDRPARSFRLA